MYYKFIFLHFLKPINIGNYRYSHDLDAVNACFSVDWKMVRIFPLFLLYLLLPQFYQSYWLLEIPSWFVK